MTVLHWYALVGVPLVLLAGGYAAVCLSAFDARRDQHPRIRQGE